MGCGPCQRATCQMDIYSTGRGHTREEAALSSRRSREEAKRHGWEELMLGRAKFWMGLGLLRCSAPAHRDRGATKA